jgi:hypothetical protein
MKTKGYEGDLAVISHTEDPKQMQGLVKGLGLFFHYVNPIAVFVGASKSMQLSAEFLEKSIRNVGAVVTVPALDHDSYDLREKLLQDILSEVKPEMVGLIVVAGMFSVGYLKQNIHKQGTFSGRMQPGSVLMVDNYGKNYWSSRDGVVTPGE